MRLLVLALAACGSSRPPPSSPAPGSPAPVLAKPDVEPAAAPEHCTGTIVKIIPDVLCGDRIGVTHVQYTGFVLEVPCIEFPRSQGLRYSVGDTHAVDVADHTVTAIAWNGRRWPIYVAKDSMPMSTKLFARQPGACTR